MLPVECISVVPVLISVDRMLNFSVQSTWHIYCNHFKVVSIVITFYRWLELCVSSHSFLRQRNWQSTWPRWGAPTCQSPFSSVTFCVRSALWLISSGRLSRYPPTHPLLTALPLFCLLLLSWTSHSFVSLHRLTINWALCGFCYPQHVTVHINSFSSKPYWRFVSLIGLVVIKSVVGAQANSLRCKLFYLTTCSRQSFMPPPAWTLLGLCAW